MPQNIQLAPYPAGSYKNSVFIPLVSQLLANNPRTPTYALDSLPGIRGYPQAFPRPRIKQIRTHLPQNIIQNPSGLPTWYIPTIPANSVFPKETHQSVFNASLPQSGGYPAGVGGYYPSLMWLPSYNNYGRSNNLVLRPVVPYAR